MLLKNKISILRNKQPAIEPDYCLSFDGKGYIDIDGLNTFLDLRNDFSFTMEFNISQLAKSGHTFLMNSCVATSNKIGIAIDGNYIYVQFVVNEETTVEIYTPFSYTASWHTISIKNNKGHLSATLDGIIPLNINPEPSITLPSTTGFRIASDTEQANSLSGLVDNILLTNLIVSIAQYPLISGSVNTAFDSVNHYNGTITNGTWQSRIL